RVRAGLHRGPDAQLRGREDVGLLAVGVVEQRDPSRPVRVVLDRRHLRRHAVLASLEVDDAVAALAAATLVARRDPAAVVAAALLRQRREQALLRLRLRDLLEGGDRHEAAAGARRLVPTNWHLSGLLGTRSRAGAAKTEQRKDAGSIRSRRLRM